MDAPIRYGLIVVCAEARSGVEGNPIVTHDGARAWVCNTEWVEATGSKHAITTGEVPRDAKTFDTPEAAAAFAKRWPGHPWYVQPRGESFEFEIVPLRQRFKTKPDGYERVAPARLTRDGGEG